MIMSTFQAAKQIARFRKCYTTDSKTEGNMAGTKRQFISSYVTSLKYLIRRFLVILPMPEPQSGIAAQALVALTRKYNSSRAVIIKSDGMRKLRSGGMKRDTESDKRAVFSSKR